MILANTVKEIIQYVTEGFIRIFSPTNDHYPEVGIQPFSGTINQPTSYYDW